jgi:uncharacterized Fe-S center protein
MPEVFFASMKAEKEGESLLKKIDRLCARVLPGAAIKKDELVAVKMHFGEQGLYTYNRPIFVARIVDAVKKAGGKPFLTDANTLYHGSRSNSVDHLNNAQVHGFIRPVVDAPVIIADGLHGHDFRAVPIKGRHFKSVKIASAIAESEAIIGIAHFKGHMASGFGGQIKNIGMGSGSRAGKQQMHSDMKPQVDAKKCKGCGRCAKNCLFEAITMLEGRANIDVSKCSGCGECFATCANNGIKIQWDSSGVKVQEKMAEYALGVVQGKRTAFFNFIVDVTPECDCFGWSGTRLGPDVGVLASGDMVAIDQASIDLLKKAHGKDTIKEAHGIDWSAQLSHGEEIGLGSRKYEITEV